MGNAWDPMNMDIEACIYNELDFLANNFQNMQTKKVD